MFLLETYRHVEVLHELGMLSNDPRIEILGDFVHLGSNSGSGGNNHIDGGLRHFGRESHAVTGAFDVEVGHDTVLVELGGVGIRGGSFRGIHSGSERAFANGTGHGAFGFGHGSCIGKRLWWVFETAKEDFLEKRESRL